VYDGMGEDAKAASGYAGTASSLERSERSAMRTGDEVWASRQLACDTAVGSLTRFARDRLELTAAGCYGRASQWQRFSFSGSFAATQPTAALARHGQHGSARGRGRMARRAAASTRTNSRRSLRHGTASHAVSFASQPHWRLCRLGCCAPALAPCGCCAGAPLTSRPEATPCGHSQRRLPACHARTCRCEPYSGDGGDLGFH